MFTDGRGFHGLVFDEVEEEGLGGCDVGGVSNGDSFPNRIVSLDALIGCRLYSKKYCEKCNNIVLVTTRGTKQYNVDSTTGNQQS